VKPRLYWLATALLAWPLVSPATPAQQLTLGGKAFQFSVAADPETRRQGLMGQELAPQTGMLFDFPAGTRPAIWMYNMQISLDLLFVDSDGRIQHVFAEVPPCRQKPCSIYQASKPLRYVLEVPAGTAKTLGIEPGDQLDMSRLPLSAPTN